MSSEATSWVLNHSPARGTDRLVLLVLANHCGRSPDDDGWECYPGVERIARQAGIERTRTVQTSLARLVEMGAIERVLNGAPDERVPKHKRTNLYRVLVDGGECGDRSCRTCAGVTSGADRGDTSRPTGVTRNDTPRGDTSRHPKPERETGDGTGEETTTAPRLELDVEQSTTDVERVFAAWVLSTGRSSRTLLDSKRRKLIERALQQYPLDDVLDAVAGWEHSAHHRGENDSGTVYNDLGLLLRDAAHIERFRDARRRPPERRRNKAAREQQFDDSLDNFLRDSRAGASPFQLPEGDR